VVPACAAFDRSDLGVIETQIQSLHQIPDRARTVILFEESFNIHCAQKNLAAINRS
jgi:hypothetical protein